MGEFIFWIFALQVFGFIFLWAVHYFKSVGTQGFDKRKYIREQNLIKKKEYEEKIKKMRQFNEPHHHKDT
eukprot:CAMPEP_0170482884 /NCGR_PEP_ID=MMETSP0208-20121228/2703_1 /TAXON_ID=197538 /ORGANISM="Strombidium inclinatum, Strain S3" /LENGTH=69 /DNA_ID=CAMNT_0010755769 /DNA_START=931 /DNA_END=1137 /DNA_ORIENTATION=+